MKRKQHFDRSLLPDPIAFYEGMGAKLVGRGEWRTCLCPFHADTRPSLRINIKTGGYKCMSCGSAGGDVVDFVRRYRGLSFREAVMLLNAWR